MNEMKNDVIIIGGGLAGLTTAVYLARAGKTVTILEKSRQIGGRAATQAKEGFLLNQGPHALYIEGAGHAILKELGVPFRGKKPVTVKKSFGVINGGLDLLPGDPLSILQTQLMSGRQKLKFFGVVQKLMKLDPQSVAHVPAGEWISTQTDEAEIQLLLGMLGRVSCYANAPELFSADVLVQQLQYALGKNVLYLDGGWQTLVEGVAERAVQTGVSIRTSQRVTAVTEYPDHVSIRLANGEYLSAQQVVFTLSPTQLAELLPNHPDVTRWAETAVPVKVSVLDVALRRLPDPKKLVVLGIDEPLYLSVHSSFADLAPHQGAMIHVAKYLAPDETGEQGRAELEKLLDLAQAGWRDEVVYQRYLPEMTVTNWLVTAEGGGLNGRPPLQLPNRQRLFLAGDWVGNKGWLADASFASGKMVAEKLLATSHHPEGHELNSVLSY